MEYKTTARKTRDMDTKEQVLPVPHMIESPHDIACKAAQAGYLAAMKIFDKKIREKLNYLYCANGNGAFVEQKEKEISVIQSAQLKAVRALSGIKPVK